MQLIISLGDPYSVNIELVSKVFTKLPQGTLIIGSYYHWQDQLRALGQTLKVDKIQSLCEKDTGICFLDIGGAEKQASHLSPVERGTIAVKALEQLKSIPQSKSARAILTMPIDKHACHEAGFRFPGHTEFFADLNQKPTLMLLAGPRLRVGLASNHLALSEVSSFLTQERLLEKLELLYKALQEIFKISKPRIAVCGLNPHCGDQGLFGDEEIRIIKPALEKFQKGLVGPVPADTIFHRALAGHFDAVLAMYHDQGLGPLKTVHFDEAVNITCGLPYLRLSPDHGPAKDLFLQNKASSRSLEEALKLVQVYLGESP